MRNHYYYYFKEISCGVKRASVGRYSPLKFSGSAPKFSVELKALELSSTITHTIKLDLNAVKLFSSTRCETIIIIILRKLVVVLRGPA